MCGCSIHGCTLSCPCPCHNEDRSPRATRRKWKPGEVLMIPGVGKVFVTSNGGTKASGERFSEQQVDRFLGKRPLVVIDPEDRDQAKRLFDRWCDNLGGTESEEQVNAMQAALREFANPTPPKPTEPKGLGAVVEDSDGRRWVRHSNTPGTFPWLREGYGTEGWSNIKAVRILSDGVQP